MVYPVFISERKSGFVLVTVMMILLILTLIGIMATNTTDLELRISGNEKVHRQTFYQADGGSELAERLIFENAVCASVKNGFTATEGNGDVRIAGHILSENKVTPFSEEATLADPVVSDANRGAVFYPDGSFNDANPHTNIRSTFTTVLTAGAGQQMVSGYEGLGAGTAGGGSHRKYIIATQHRGVLNSQTLLATQWKLDNFILASAASSDCRY